MPEKRINWAFGLLILAAAVVAFGGGGLPIIGGKATAAVYVYEKDSGGVPSEVTKALSKLNEREGFIATTHEDDATTGAGSIPKQYAKSLPAARAAGLPALVVMAGERVLRTVSKPTTEAQVLEAVP